MRTTRLAVFAALTLLVALASTGCLTIPQVKDRQIDLATTISIALPVSATGSTNLDANQRTVNLRDSLNFQQKIQDVGIAAEDLKSITLSKIQYRIVTPDPTATRTITGGISIKAGGAASMASLVSVTAAPAGAVTGWLTPTVNAAGVGQVNTMLAAILTELQGGAAANETVTYNESGTSAPAAVATNFIYQVRLTFTIVGKVKTKVIT